ncbi:MAG: cytochrome c biogenesis protein ResB [Pseudomonadota bacterium]
MNLAITLLVAVGLASVVGTVLQQNQPYGDYLMKFGPFWFEVFRALDLYDVYSAPWFLAIFTLLVVSTSACVIRNAPSMLREMFTYRSKVGENELRAMRGHVEWPHLPMSVEAAAIESRRVLFEEGFKFKESRVKEGYMFSARKGSLQRLGYVFTHVAIVVICIGGMMDSRLWLSYQELIGKLKVETRSVPLSQVPEQSRVTASNPGFRGNVNVPEGSSSSVLFLNVRDGYVVQNLPFEVAVKDFRIEHYDNGMPKSYESDLLITDPKHPSNEPVKATIAVNKPMIYNGYAIYQASFGDGGSRMQFKSWQLQGGAAGVSQPVSGAIFQDIPFSVGDSRYTLELNDFRLFNINPVTDAEGKMHEKNFGPSVVFRLRDGAGQAREYENYMAPVEMEGRAVFISGMRDQIGGVMRFLYIPADRDAQIDAFMDFYRRLHDAGQIDRAVLSMLAEVNPEAAKLPAASEAIRSMVEKFVQGGYDAIGADLETRIPKDQLERAFETSARVLQTVLSRMYVTMMQERGVQQIGGEKDERFLADSVAAINALAFYGSPIFLQLTGFEQIQASGLQITKSPGKDVVYLGSFLLMLGVFMLFYIHPRRAWVLVRESVDARGARVLFATTSHRKTLDMARASRELHQKMVIRLGAEPIRMPGARAEMDE